MQDDAGTLPSAVRLTSLAHGGGCGCKLSPAVLTEILAEHAGGGRPSPTCWSGPRPATTRRSGG